MNNGQPSDPYKRAVKRAEEDGRRERREFIIGKTKRAVRWLISAILTAAVYSFVDWLLKKYMGE